jgi:hypothetical protein
VRQSVRFHLLALPPLACAVALASGCSADKKTSGELIVAIQTDMSLPKDIDQVRIDVRSFGNVVFKNTYPVGAGGLRIPATLGILPGADARSLITIRVIAFQRGKPRMLREVVTTVPESRLATLRLPVQWISDGSAKQPDPTNEEDIRSSCADGNTDIAGECVPWDIDSSTLPDHKPEEIFGGGKEDGTGGSCFNTSGCLAGATPLQVDTATCTAIVPEGLGTDPAKLNVGLVLAPGGDGICNETGCLIPLDANTNVGWVAAGAGLARVQLPRKICDKLAAGIVKSVVASSSCASKLPSMPTCGPWSSVGIGPSTGGGGGDDTVDAGTTTPCTVPECGGTPGDASVPSTCQCTQTCNGTVYALVCDGSNCRCTAAAKDGITFPQSTICLDINQQHASLDRCKAP